MEIEGSSIDPGELPAADCFQLPHLLHHFADQPAPYSSRRFDSAFAAAVVFVVVVVLVVAAAAVAFEAALQPFLADPSWQVSAGVAFPALPTVAVEAGVVGSFSAAAAAFVVVTGLAHLSVGAAAAWAQLPTSFPEVLAAAVVPSAPCSQTPVESTLAPLPCPYQGGLLPSVLVAADGVGAVASCQLGQPVFVEAEHVPSFSVHLPLVESSWQSPQQQAEDLWTAVVGT